MIDIHELGDERWNADDECMEYTHSDMQLRIAAKGLMMARDDKEFKSPRKCAEIERELGHVVFELAYRTQTVQEYIEMNRQAVDLSQLQEAS